MAYEILDVSSWYEDVEEYGQGEREKLWLINPSNKKLAMLKYPREERGKHWAEKLCFEFSHVLGFSCATVDLAHRNGRIGSLSHFFVEKEKGFSHYDGGKYFPQNYDRIRNIGYTFQIIKEVLDQFPEQNLIDQFLRIMVFDALVGQGDRHQDNWGITRSENSNVMFISPMYDNSASLGREQTNDRASELVKSKDYLLAYIQRSKSKIGWSQTRQTKHFVLIDELINLYPEIISRHLIQLNLLSDEIIHDIVFKLPSEVITKMQKEFVIKYVVLRRNILLKKVMK